MRKKEIKRKIKRKKKGSTALRPIANALQALQSTIDLPSIVPHQSVTNVERRASNAKAEGENQTGDLGLVRWSWTLSLSSTSQQIQNYSSSVGRLFGHLKQKSGVRKHLTNYTTWQEKQLPQVQEH